MKVKSYEELVAWQKAMLLAKMVYGIQEQLSKEELYGLGDQIRRAVVSVPSNIAEGMSRLSDKEKVHFMEISYGSLMEVLCQMEISKELNYVTEEQMKDIENQITIIAKQL